MYLHAHWHAPTGWLAVCHCTLGGNSTQGAVMLWQQGWQPSAVRTRWAELVDLHLQMLLLGGYLCSQQKKLFRSHVWHWWHAARSVDFTETHRHLNNAANLHGEGVLRNKYYTASSDSDENYSFTLQIEFFCECIGRTSKQTYWTTGSYSQLAVAASCAWPAASLRGCQRNVIKTSKRVEALSKQPKYWTNLRSRS